MAKSAMQGDAVGSETVRERLGQLGIKGPRDGGDDGGGTGSPRGKDPITRREAERRTRATLPEIWDQVTAATPTAATIDLTDPQPVAIELRANRPSRVTVRGPRDLVFAAFRIACTGEPLMRDLTDADRWGAEIQDDGGTITLAFAQHERVIGAALYDRDADQGETKGGDIFARKPPRITAVETGVAPQLQAIEDLTAGTQLDFLADTGALRLVASTSPAPSRPVWLVLSPSSARNVALTVGDDSVQQVLPAEFGPGVGATSRDLAGPANAAWQRAAGTGDEVAVTIGLTSVRDGLIEVGVDGAWSRRATGLAATPGGPFQPSLAAEVVPGHATRIHLPPLAAATGAITTLTASARIESGTRLGFGGPVPPPDQLFRVRVDEEVHLAVAMRLVAPGAAVAAAGALHALWLALPAVPTAPAVLRCSVDRGSPGATLAEGEHLGRAELELPVDATAYRGAGPHARWYRAVLPEPIALDGAAAADLLVLSLTGDRDGTELLHRRSPGAPALPDGPGFGGAHYRRLSRHGRWQQRFFADHASEALIDLELDGGEPTPGLIRFGAAAALPTTPDRWHRQPLPLGSLASTDLDLGGDRHAALELEAEVELPIHRS